MIPAETQALLLMLTGGAVALAMMSIGFQMSINHKKEKKQKTGLELLTILKNVLLNLQKHRGTSYRILWGEKNLDNTLITLQQNTARAMHELKALKEHKYLSERWLAFEDHWGRLSNNCLSLDAENNLEQHNKIINTFIYLMEDVAEQHHLSEAQLDLSAAHTINNGWKEVLTTAEWVGQARALGAGMLTSGNYGSVERIRMSFIRSKLAKFAQQSGHHSAANIQLGNFVSIIEKELLEKSQPDITSKDYFDQASTTIESYMQQFDREIHDLRVAIH